MELPQKVLAKASINQTSSVIKSAPYIQIGLIIMGIILGVLLGTLYQGKLPTTYLYSPTLSEFFRNDKIEYPNTGFSYIHYLRSFPTQIFENPSQIGGLWISGGAINSIPEDLSSLQGIKTFNLTNNHLSELPNGIGGLSLLEELDFGGNRLKNIPSSIGNLTSLKKLYLYDNKLEVVPDEIGNLTGLEMLDLHLNDLTTLPSTFANLQSLKVLYLGGNKFSETEQGKIQNMLPNTLIFF